MTTETSNEPSRETKKHKFVRTLRAIADFVDSHPFDSDSRYETLSLYIFCRDAMEFGRNVAAAGSVVKSAGGDYLNADIKLGAGNLQITIEQEYVCKRIKVGEKVIPAKEEYTVPATEKRVEDVFEFECPESFLALKD